MFIFISSQEITNDCLIYLDVHLMLLTYIKHNMTA